MPMMTRSTPKNLRPVPIGGVASLLTPSAPVAPTLGAPVVAPLGVPVAPTVPAPAAPVVSMGSSSAEMPVEGGQPEEMRFTQGEYYQFMNSLDRANLGEQDNYINIGDFFRRDPESDPETPSYLFTGMPINFYGGYGEDKDGNTVKITSGKAVFTGGSRKGEPISKEFVVNRFMQDLMGIDESGGGGGDFGGQEGEGSGAHGGGHGHGAPDTSGTEGPSG